jgi:arsenate reductase-like glutaredoxin family protein
MVLQIYSVGDDCECCKKLIAWLEQRGIPYQVVDVTQYQ